ncbi:Glycosyl transferase family 2 [Verrucomicrobium sp. GAS474]|uniref:glycosyltransferase family 2 protein n=1 Tax=Verrucomicrobium sp. GAS474 TaxID=1882831 RepID=UPI00087D561C|nr:glycosyltransferase family A protein [Verrucomicrobium sp. GAS474]SDT99267.1 Glycosyl transferase family 2 [Verrucomicrobium sp. GAS474]
MSSPAPRVSVVIHFLNSLKHLPAAVESVRAQTFTDWELVLVDGGSTDGTVEWVKALAAREPERIRAFCYADVRKEGEPARLGVYPSRIWGAREAKAPLLGLIDSDDLWHPLFLERQYALYKATLGDRPGMVYCPMVYFWDDPIENLRSFVQRMPSPGLHEPPSILHSFYDNDYETSAGNTTTFIARECVVAADALTSAASILADDQFLWAYVGLRWPIVVNPEPLVWYRQWPGSNCATMKSDAGAVRRRHLAWFHDYVTKEYHGPAAEKEALLRHTEKWIKEIDHPPGPLGRKWKQWKAGLRRRLT